MIREEITYGHIKMDSIRNDLSERELSGKEAQDRAKWRRLIPGQTHRPHVKVGKDAEEEEERWMHLIGKNRRALL